MSKQVDERVLGIAARYFPEADHRAARCAGAVETGMSVERDECAKIATEAARQAEVAAAKAGVETETGARLLAAALLGHEIAGRIKTRCE